ncbi:MAG: NAD-dependent epimerase/dehydratase family protein [Crocinitomicaceae bacterium]|nr:NAD-dependent epimerase/dehydratase family protein [Crocinitomicaceae bacterium]
MQGKSLIIGASGQIGIELVIALRKLRGESNVIASDLRDPVAEELKNGPFEIVDTLDRKRIESVIDQYGITEVYQLAALLSATSEKFPDKAWNLNMNGLFNILEIAKEKKLEKVFWPSSIAVFGPTTPKDSTPQFTIMEPTSVYGISKLAGERWCEYYYQKFGVDVRSLRYPGLIGFRSEPGGGTTDYAVDIFYHAIENARYSSFLSANTMLPMMMMEDAIRATITIMGAPAEKIAIRSSYNIAGMSFTPAQLAAEISKHIVGFRMDYSPDFRQSLADSWPSSIDDSYARRDWGWLPSYHLDSLVSTMLAEIRKKKLAHCETP